MLPDVMIGMWSSAKGGGMSADELLRIMCENTGEELIDVSLPVTSIANGIFWFATGPTSGENRWLRSLDLPNLVSLGYRSVFYCSNLKRISMPSLVSTVSPAYRTLKGCTSLEYIDIPLSRDAWTMSDGLPLRVLNMRSSVDDIAKYVGDSKRILSGDRDIEYFDMRNMHGVLDVGYAPFFPTTGRPVGIEKLKYINVGGVTSCVKTRSSDYYSTLSGAYNLETVVLGGETFICGVMFNGLGYNIRNIKFTEGFKYYGYSAETPGEICAWCSKLYKVDFPSTTTHIGGFYKCGTLQDGTYYIPEFAIRSEIPPQMGGKENEFFSETKAQNLYVPASSISAYRESSLWGDKFVNILPLEDLPSGFDDFDWHGAI